MHDEDAEMCEKEIRKNERQKSWRDVAWER